MSQKTTKKIIIGNWKMNPSTKKEATKLFSEIGKSILKIKKTQVVVCSPFLYLEQLKKLSKKVGLGAQNLFWEESGAFTGEISGDMLYEIGARYVILGHSERRAMGETNIDINKKIKSAIFTGLTPVLCIGEKERDENHDYLNFIKTQIEECFSGIVKSSVSKVIIAYEPIWAIGKSATREATGEEAREISIFIRKVLSDKFGISVATDIKIIYGGSVNSKNALGFLVEGQADGFLVGRDSLNAKKFFDIINIAENLN